MKKVICFFLLFFSFNVGFSQTEEDHIQNIKVYYAKNIKSKACDEANKGLQKYPTSARIGKLKGLVCSPIKNNPPTGGSPTGGSPTGGSPTGGSPTGGTTRGSTTGGTTTGGLPIINVSSGFKRIADQNRVEWSKSLTDNAISISIRYTVKGVGVLVDESVTGRTYHIYDPGTSRAAGRSTKVELIVDYGDKKVNESGILVLDNQFFVCSAN
jgi:hypothetical protein